ncbi:MAG: putative heme d1 biosynthesis radical SAM protein NirJ2 [Coriobacteriales bacterium]|jgi:putative heme d1 biosynthesis radical SAM protein NirJ2|nr:putative heme d1 biosynthesis radical SAM protein NirJ2 [Coriobacteriales bacterium]
MIVSWLTTNRCNLKCQHCYQDADTLEASTANELDTLEAKTLIDQIARAGFKIMIFSGGEPLLREDIFELVAYASFKGLRPVFGTNGMLITLEVAQKLKAAGAAAMGISLDSLDEAKHNNFRGDPDAWRLAIQGMENCTAAGLPFQIHTTIVDWNKDEVLDIIDFAVEKGAIAHQPFFLIPVGRGVYIAETSIEVLENEELLSKIMEKSTQVPISVKPTCAPQFVRIAEQLGIETRYSRGCLAGLTYCIINPQGIVQPCAYMKQQAGNVRQQDFDVIWAESPLFETLRTEAYADPCGSCDYKKRCGGCRARAAYYHEDNFMAADEYCAHGKQLTLEGSVK